MAEAMMYAADVDEAISEELTRKIHEAIDSLPLQCCQIVRMHIIDGKKYTEISAELGISINTIKTQIFRGYKKLRELLAISHESYFYFISVFPCKSGFGSRFPVSYRLKCKYSKNRLHRKDYTGIEKLQY